MALSKFGNADQYSTSYTCKTAPDLHKGKLLLPLVNCDQIIRCWHPTGATRQHPNVLSSNPKLPVVSQPAKPQAL